MTDRRQLPLLIVVARYELRIVVLLVISLVVLLKLRVLIILQRVRLRLHWLVLLSFFVQGDARLDFLNFLLFYFLLILLLLLFLDNFR